MDHESRRHTASTPPSGAAVAFFGSQLVGPAVGSLVRTAGDMHGFFQDDAALRQMATDTPMYRVDTYTPVPAGTVGGLFFGVTHLRPGVVGNEYYMTKGHVHTTRDRAEYYWGISGQGILVLMDSNRVTRTERVCPGSLHYIPAATAHRLVNVGATVLDVGACWPADAGHEYGPIAAFGFGLRVVAAGSNGVALVAA